MPARRLPRAPKPWPARAPHHRVRPRAAAVAAFALALALAPAFGHARDPVPFTAHEGLALAVDAAQNWAADARLIYLENDEPVGEGGAAPRWGYLFFSRTRNAARGYSVRDGRIAAAADLGFDLQAPPLPAGWVDSAQALAAAEEKEGARYRAEHGGQLATMLLLRGAFRPDDPDRTTWALVYTSQGAPTLFVVVDAGTGKVVRTWQG
jgi:hypothetical protein